MTRTTFALAAALSLGTAAPALAAYDTVGSVNVDFRRDRDAKNVDFGGPVERIQLTATRSDIDCRSVTARFGNGKSREIFQGRLRQGRGADVDLPGGDRNVTRLIFQCGARDKSGGTIRISADIGRYQDEWRRHPDFNRLWSRVFNWGMPAIAGRANRGPQSGWQLVSTERFEGRNDIETSVAGWRGRRVESIALKPLDANARCRQVTAHFGNGNARDLDLPRGNYLRQGRLQQIDLPGDARNLRSVTMRCRATDARRVAIQVFVGG